MYFGYLIALALVITSSVGEDTLSATLESENMMSLSTDELCRSAGFVKDNPPVEVHSSGLPSATKSGLSVQEIILVTCGVVAVALCTAFLANCVYYKVKRT